MSSIRGTGIVLWDVVRPYAFQSLIIKIYVHFYEFAGKPARETNFNMASWIHLPEPRVNVYVRDIRYKQYGLYFDLSVIDPSYLLGRKRKVSTKARGGQP